MNLLERYDEFTDKVRNDFYRKNPFSSVGVIGNKKLYEKYAKDTYKDFESLEMNINRNYIIINFKKDEYTK